MTDNDNGYSSRKFWLVEQFLALITAGYIATMHWESARPEFGTWGGLMLTGLGLYFGVNFAHKKWTSSEQETEEFTEAPAPEKK